MKNQVLVLANDWLTVSASSASVLIHCFRLVVHLLKGDIHSCVKIMFVLLITLG